MIEYAIQITDPNDNVGSPGDAVVAKLSPAIWSVLELQQYLIVLSDDIELESRLIAMRDAGDEYPVITNPYAVYADRVSPRGLITRTLQTASTWRVDVAAIAEIRPEILDPTVATDPIVVEDAGWIDTTAIDAGSDVTPAVRSPNVFVRVAKTVLGWFGL